MISNLIEVKQLPIIEEQLQIVKKEVEGKVQEALSLACTESTMSSVKTARAELNKQFKEFEEKRKQVKKSILAPYENFERIYKDCISDIFKSADVELKKKIDNVEQALKEEKREQVEIYFNEYLKSKEIDFVSFEDANIGITLSTSLKSLKEQSKAFIDKIVEELMLISTQEHEDEILYEYKQSLNAVNAISVVLNRHKALEEQKAVEEQKTVEEPVKVIEKATEAQRLVLVNFRVKGTIAQLKALKEFLNNGGYDYE